MPSFTGVDQCGNPVGVSGTFNFNGMIAAGFLDATGAAATGIDYRFDNCSQTVSSAPLQELCSFVTHCFIAFCL
jgi:hypothetical protein